MNYKTAVASAAAQPPKMVVVDLEYMRPSVSRSGSRSGSRSRSRSQSRSRSHARSRSHSRTGTLEEYNDLNIDELLNRQYTNGLGVSDDSNDISESDETGSGTGTGTGTGTDSESDIEDDYPSTHPSIKDTDYAANSDDDLLQSVLDEPTFPLDVNAILNAMNKSENSTIANTKLAAGPAATIKERCQRGF